MHTRHTDRLRLEPISPGHAGDLWLVFQDKHIAHWYGGPWTRQDAAGYAATSAACWQRDGVHKWLAYHRDTGEVVGRGGLSRTEVTGQERLEVGWAIREPFRGQGYATEIGRAGLDLAFGDLGADEVIAFTEHHNDRSRAVMHRLGMHYDGERGLPSHGDTPFAFYRARPPSVEANGIRLTHRVAGDPAHPPMVLLHGLGDSRHDWQPVLPALAETFRVHALDLRGHGGSDRPGAYSFALMRDDVLGYLDTMGIERCVLAGHSMGAVVATLVAEAAPHRLTRLILEDATPPRPGDLDRPPMTDPDLPEVVNPIRAQLTSPDPAWWEATATIRTPTLIIGGSGSPLPHHLLTATADRMPDATLVTITAGHHVHRDNPAGFLTAVSQFLQNDESDA
ncbi:GNAT family N-acetyltransferase [Actinoplanes sp. GCM10030250]|uniref:GNAT family N-acetyltransferase n=1 Tax=Actinoplanes sp. GCM10030250 TaxID=3273376 RepID=UPI0036100F6D